MKYFILSIYLIFSGCAALDKTLAPVDGAVNSTKSTYSDVANSSSKALNYVSDGYDSTKATVIEGSGLILSDETRIKNREDNYIAWDKSQSIDGKTIIKKQLRKNKSKLREKDLPISEKMKILNSYFFEKQESRYRDEFTKLNPKVKFDKFKTDRENIENLYQYKEALKESEHQWQIDQTDIQKRVAKSMLIALYGSPKLKFISYDPNDEEIFFELSSSYNDFKEKIKFEENSDVAKKIEKNVRTIKPDIYFKIDDDGLDFIGVNATYRDKTYLCDVVDTAYVRENNIKFVSDGLVLQSEDVDYTEVIKNITPPDWYLNLSEENIGYGQGLELKDAKANAYNNIAESKKITISSKLSLSNKTDGSMHSSSSDSSINQQVDKVTIKNSKVKKEEMKDGIWFVAISY